MNAHYKSSYHPMDRDFLNWGSSQLQAITAQQQLLTYVMALVMEELFRLFIKCLFFNKEILNQTNQTPKINKNSTMFDSKQTSF